MYQVLLRDYEVSIWTLQDSFISVLKPSGSNIKGQLDTSSLIIKDDGTLEFSFKIPIKYRDDSGTLIDNPLWVNVTNGNLIANMRKIKLIFNKHVENREKVYELEITKVIEEHAKDILTCKVETQGLAFHELGKIGYKIKLSQDNIVQDSEKWAKAESSYDAEGKLFCKIYKENGEHEFLFEEPRATLSYWNDKIFKPGGKWSYEIRMNYTGNNAGLGLKSNEVYEDSYIKAWKYDDTHDMIVGSEIQDTQVKARLIDVSESNIYNITQELAKTFGVFCRYEYEHDDQYYITGRKVIYYNNFLSEGEGTFDITYPYDTKSISRTSDGTDLVTKMYVQPDESSDDYITIMNSPVNKTREDYILNFDYLHLIGAITDVQYDAVKTFEKDVARINLEVIPVQNQIAALENQLPKLLATQATLNNAIALDKEQLSASGELVDLITNETGIISKTNTNPETSIILEDRHENRYITFSTKGIIVETIKIYTDYNYATQTLSNLLLETSPSNNDGQSNQTANEQNKLYKCTYDEYSNLIRIDSQVFANDKIARVYITYDYSPDLYTEKVKELWEGRLANDTRELAETEAKINNINETLDTLYNKKVELLAEKDKLLANFEYLMGPALREGYWTPEEYQDYGESYNVDFNFYLGTPCAKELEDLTSEDPEDIALNNEYLKGEQEGVPISAKIIFDQTPFENEFKLDYDLFEGGTDRYPYILVDSYSMFSWVRENYDKLSVVFKSTKSSQKDDQLIYKHIYTIGSQCKYGIIRHATTTYDTSYNLAIILTGAKELSEGDMTILMGNESGLHLAVIDALTVEGASASLNEATAFNQGVTIRKDLVNDILVYPRIQINSLQLRTTSDQLVIKTILPGTVYRIRETGSGGSGEGGGQPGENLLNTNAFSPKSLRLLGADNINEENNSEEEEEEIVEAVPEEELHNNSFDTKNNDPEDQAIFKELVQLYQDAGNSGTPSTTTQMTIAGPETILEPYKDYSILSRENGYFLTINPTIFARDGIFLEGGGGVGNVQLYKFTDLGLQLSVHYVISNAESVIYLDALQISKENAYPKVSYDVKLSILAQQFLIDSFNLIGRITNINDLDLGFEHVQGYVSEVKINPDSAQNDELVIKNYKTKFEDLFTSIVAQTEAMQKNANVISIAAASFTPTGMINPDVLANTMRHANLDYAFNNGTLTISDTEGIWATSDDGVVAMRGGGIFTATEKDGNDNWVWNTGIVPSGINANLITAGQIDTNRIKIFAGDEVKFQMNGDGIFAYKNSGADLTELINKNEEIPETNDNHRKSELIAQVNQTYTKAGIDPKQYVVYNSEGLFLKAKEGAQVGLIKNQDDDYIIQTTNQDVDRVSISWNGLTLKNYNGEETLYADAETGNLHIKGTLEAADGIFSGALQAATGSFKGEVEATAFKLLAPDPQNSGTSSFQEVFTLENDGTYSLNPNIVPNVATDLQITTTYYCAVDNPDNIESPTITWYNSINTALSTHNISGPPYYQWTRTATTVNSVTSYSYACSRVAKDGNNGDGGTAGRGIQSITNYYLATQNNTAPAIENNSAWKESYAQAGFAQNTPYLWGYELTTYTSGTATSHTDPHLIAVWGQDGTPAPIIYNISCTPNVLIADTATTLQVSITSSDGSTPTGLTAIYKVDGTEPNNSTIQNNSITCFGDSGITPQNNVTLVLKDNNGEILDQQTIPVLYNGENGEDAYTLILSNENDTFIQGNNEQTKTTTLSLYKGTTLQTLTASNIEFSPSTVLDNFTITKTVNNGTAEVQIKNSTIDENQVKTIHNIDAGGYINFNIVNTSGTNFPALTKQFTYSSVLQGSNGSNGTNAATYNIVPSSTVVIKDVNNNSLIPNNLTVTTTVTFENNNNITSTAYGGYVTYQTNNGSETAWPTSNNNTLTLTSNMEYITIKLYNNSTDLKLLDSQTVPVISEGKDGQDAYTLVLTNDNDSFIQGPSPQTKRTSLKLYNGITDNTDELRDATWGTSNYKIECSDTENIKVTPVYNSTTNTVDFTITNSFANPSGGSIIDHNVNQGGTVTITIIYNDVTLSKVFSYSSVIQGTNALTYTILPSASIIAYDGNGYTPATISATGYKSIGETIMTELPQDDDSWSITYKVDNGNPQILTDSSITIAAGTQQITFYLKINNKIVDYQTVPVVSKGADGKDAYTVLLTNENASFVKGVAKTVTTNVMVYKGTTQLNYTSSNVTLGTFKINAISNMPAGFSSINMNSAPTITITSNTNLTTDGNIPFEIVIENSENIVTKTFSYSVVENGAEGVGINQIYEYYQATTTWEKPTGLSLSNITPGATPIGNWKTSSNDVGYGATKRFLWNTELVTYTGNKNPTASTPTLISIYNADTTELELSELVLRRNKNGDYYPTSITAKAYDLVGLSKVQNTSKVIKWKIGNTYYATGLSFLPNSTSGSNIKAALDSQEYITVQVFENNESSTPLDAQTIPILRDGVDGQGADAYTIVLSNENYTFTNAIDAPENTSQSIETTVQVYKGTNSFNNFSISNSITDNYLNCTVSGHRITFTYPKTNATSATELVSGSVAIPITIESSTITKAFSYTILPPKSYYASTVSDVPYITEIVPLYCLINSSTPPMAPSTFVPPSAETTSSDTTNDESEEEEEIVNEGNDSSSSESGENTPGSDGITWYRAAPTYITGYTYYTSTMYIWSASTENTTEFIYDNKTYYCTFSQPSKDQSLLIAMAGQTTALEVAKIIGRFSNSGINQGVLFNNHTYAVALTAANSSTASGLLIGANDRITIRQAGNLTGAALELDHDGISLAGANIIMTTTSSENVISMRASNYTDDLGITHGPGILVGSTGTVSINGGNLSLSSGGEIQVETDGKLIVDAGDINIQASTGQLAFTPVNIYTITNSNSPVSGDVHYLPGYYLVCSGILEPKPGTVVCDARKVSTDAWDDGEWYYAIYQYNNGQWQFISVSGVSSQEDSTPQSQISNWDYSGEIAIAEEDPEQSIKYYHYTYPNTESERTSQFAKLKSKIAELLSQASLNTFYIDPTGVLYCRDIICANNITCNSVQADTTAIKDSNPTPTTTGTATDLASIINAADTTTVTAPQGTLQMTSFHPTGSPAGFTTKKATGVMPGNAVLTIQGSLSNWSLAPSTQINGKLTLTTSPILNIGSSITLFMTLLDNQSNTILEITKTVNGSSNNTSNVIVLPIAELYNEASIKSATSIKLRLIVTNSSSNSALTATIRTGTNDNFIERIPV